MKKAVFISLIISTAFLSACNSKSIDVKEPKFVSEGSQISYEQFRDELTAAAEKIDFKKEGVIDSKEMTYETALSNKSSVTRNAKKNRTANIGTKAKGSTQFDAKKLVYISKNEQTYLTNIKDEIASESMDSSVEAESGFALVNRKTNYASVSLDNKAMTAVTINTYADFESAKEVFNAQYKSVLRTRFSLSFTNILSVTPADPDFDSYKFFKNGSVYTYTYEFTDTDPLLSVLEGEVANQNYHIYRKGQVELSESKQVAIYYSSSTLHLEYTKDFEEYRANDIFDEEVKSSYTYTINAKKVSLKDIDLDKYLIIA